MKDEKAKRPGRGKKPGLGEVVGMDVGTTGVKVVRMRHHRDGLALVACAEFPSVSLNGARPEGEVAGLQLPKEYRGRNAAIAVSSKAAVVRLLTLSGASRQSPQFAATVRNNAGLDADFRLGYSVLPGPRAKQDASVLAVGLPEGEAASLLALAEANNLGPLSLELSVLASASGFAATERAQAAEGAVGFIESGAAVTCVTIFSRGQPVLLRKFDFGSRETERRVQRQFGVDELTARNIISDEAFDIGQAVQDAMGPFLRQLAISREFVERKLGVPIRAWYLSGGITTTGYWQDRIQAAVGGSVENWNPLEGLEVLAEAWPESLHGQESRFGSAIGAAVGVLQNG